MEQYVKKMFEQIDEMYATYAKTLTLALKYAKEGYPNLSEVTFNRAKDILEVICEMINTIDEYLDIRKDID